MSTTPAVQPAGQAPCALCGVAGPTKYVELYQNIGMVIARRTISVKQHLCRNCIDRCFRSFTLTTLFLGWWGTVSLFITPLILVNNCVRFFMALSLERPSLAAVNRPIDAPLPRLDGTSSRFKFIYGAIVITVALGLLAFYNVAFMEKHAPRLNAMLHGGAVGGGEDAEYRGGKWNNDAVAVLADTKGQDWPAYRSELLSRAPYFTDLAAQNDKIQAALTEEREKNANIGDPCESFALSSFGPAMDELTKTETEKFAFLQRTTTLNDDARSSLKALEDREDSAVKRIQAYYAGRDKRGCK